MSSRINFLITRDRRLPAAGHEALQPIPRRQIAMLRNCCQLFVMHDQYSLHVGQLVFAQRPRVTTFTTRYTSFQYGFSSSVQVEIGARSRLAPHEERKIDDSQ
ncbi:hypothetical protein X977_3285 [Burkholderia pseudomallei MSHR7504]|nr:hypothetical protein DO63_1670 [Burkholderia pseudomallei]KGS05869.1 hypothetical protein X977_3285 [Burkholderia pseudomallei MSHR7504]